MLVLIMGRSLGRSIVRAYLNQCKADKGSNAAALMQTERLLNG